MRDNYGNLTKLEFTNPHIFPDFLANLKINMYLCRVNR